MNLSFFMVQQLSSMVAMRLRNQQIHEMSRFIRYTQNLENLKTLKHPRQKSLWPPSRNRWGGKNFSRYQQKTVSGASRVPLYAYSGTRWKENTLGQASWPQIFTDFCFETIFMKSFRCELCAWGTLNMSGDVEKTLVFFWWYMCM